MSMKKKILQTVGASALVALTISSAQANLLSNGDFETPNAFFGNQSITGGTDGWDFAFSTFTVWGDGPDNNGNFGPVAVSGSQTAKNFADGSRVEETVAVTGGLETTLSTYIINWAPDALANNGQALLELTFFSDLAGTSQISTFPLFYGVNDGLTPQDGAEISDWTLISITETAPLNALSARARLQFIPDGGGAMFWDNASLTQVPVPAAVWLFGSGLIGLVGVARRRKTQS